MDVKNSPPEILVSPHQDCDCMLAFLQGELWSVNMPQFPFLAFGALDSFMG